MIATVGLPSVRSGVGSLRSVNTLRGAEAEDLERIIREYGEALRNDPSDAEALKVIGVAYHRLGERKVDGASEKSVHHLSRAAKARPEDAEVTAFLGSAMTMLARDTWNPLSKIKKVQEGAALIDRAVAKAPDNVVVRFVRGNNSRELPGLFNRRQYVKKDFEHLVLLSTRSSEADQFTAEMRAESHFKLGEALARDRQLAPSARESWLKAIELAPESTWATEARKKLQTQRPGFGR